MDRILQDICSFVKSQVWEGFSSVDEIVEDTEDYAFEAFGREDLHQEIQHIVAEALFAHRIEQGTWESPTGGKDDVRIDNKTS